MTLTAKAGDTRYKYGSGEPTQTIAEARYSIDAPSWTTVPVLVVHGSADRTVPLEMGRRLASLFPRGTLDVVDGADHATILSRPEVLARMAAFASE